MDQENELRISITADSDADSVLTEEMFYRPKRRELPGEIALMAGLLRQAIVDRALDWINLDEDFLYSFQNCCETLGIDYLAARKALNAKIKPRCAKAKNKNVLHEVLKNEILDIPGKVYTHRYGECPPGMSPSRCHECRQRYNYRYGRLFRKSSHKRNPVAAQLAEAS